MAAPTLIPDALLKGVVFTGLFVGFLAGLAGWELSKRSDRDVNKANETAKLAEQHTAEAKAATRIAEQHIAEANTRLGQAEARVAEAKVETGKLANRAKELDLRLAQTRSLVGQRVIKADQISALAKIAPECGRGVNIQIDDEKDEESRNFAFSLGMALRHAGLKVNEVTLYPTLDSGSGWDIVFYSPKYGGIENLERGMKSEIAQFFRSIGLTASPITGAVQVVRHGVIVTRQTKENVQLDYCVFVVNKRPTPMLNGPVWPHYRGNTPKDTDFH